MNATSYLNSPVKSCRTCVHRVKDGLGPEWDHCARFQFMCRLCIHDNRLCGFELKEWRPAPPKPARRSLRQWVYDVVWK